MFWTLEGTIQIFKQPMIKRLLSFSNRVLLTGVCLFGGLTALASAPVFTINPSRQTVAAAGTATFSVSAKGRPAYQWYSAFNGATNLIAGASTTSLAVTGYYTNQQFYFCVASNVSGTAASSVVSLVVTYGWSTFAYPPSAQIYSVPFGVTNLAVDAIGAGGGVNGRHTNFGRFGSIGVNHCHFAGVGGKRKNGLFTREKSPFVTPSHEGSKMGNGRSDRI
jgi:hypothetical protein